MSNSRLPLRHLDIELLKNEQEVEIEKEKKQDEKGGEGHRSPEAHSKVSSLLLWWEQTLKLEQTQIRLGPRGCLLVKMPHIPRINNVGRKGAGTGWQLGQTAPVLPLHQGSAVQINIR